MQNESCVSCIDILAISIRQVLVGTYASVAAAAAGERSSHPMRPATPSAAPSKGEDKSSSKGGKSSSKGKPGGKSMPKGGKSRAVESLEEMGDRAERDFARLVGT